METNFSHIKSHIFMCCGPYDSEIHGIDYSTSIFVHIVGLPQKNKQHRLQLFVSFHVIDYPMVKQMAQLDYYRTSCSDHPIEVKNVHEGPASSVKKQICLKQKQLQDTIAIRFPSFIPMFSLSLCLLYHYQYFVCKDCLTGNYASIYSQVQL